jgi:hypothetical protein
VAAFFNLMISSCIDNAPAICEPLARQRSRRLTLRVNFLWTLAGNVIYAACQWGILVALAKIGTVQMVGEFALALAITAPILVGAGLALRAVEATDALGEYEFRDYFSLRLLTSAAAVLVVAGAVTLEEAFRAVWSSPFNIRNSAADLEQLYSSAR